ncbi:16S rRNA m(2)G 1207 methyltransferase [Maritimibacter alkaliphilus HTCC2654]|uniref:Possible ribosomal RNA small subunit methyltransferase C RsmC n=1 Tax=Maritimibacter alkaliphilus HTCC2654 TaxID=314271 RepID=A3VET4_9RHOB|nr:class I SAM-dependent methyltransferase [Maritimibacter alkaliphilus]EAQ13422.1 Possible ribosomal RNA small subunit methyltransferase C RsmC [Rhodobacterales bacterium HTCC2654] [Maritimibacter alkaliphilus HTCC2654]TYP85159.1 16S rRNA m(2)G 1207 methyltransferase [Maritimibacter alkaliphilus HTCC2654]
MSSARLSHALETGALVLPEGRIAVFGPPIGTDLSPLERDRVEIVSRFFPDARYWQGLGYRVLQAPEGTYATALVFLPRAKDAARALLAQASGCAGFLIVDGQKTDGVDSILKAVKTVAGTIGVTSKSHGKLFWLAAPDFPGWAGQARTVEGFVTRPGVFSADGPDKGSRALVDALPALSGRVVDLGAGWGFLARHILTSNKVTALDLVEADLTALDCARENVTDPRASFHWADATDYRPDTPVDVVVSNPPFHTGRAGDPGLGRAFIASAAAMLAPTGTFWMVANRHLPYEDALTAQFREVDEVGGTPGFKVIRASKPLRSRT